MLGTQPFRIHTPAGATDLAGCVCLLVPRGTVRLGVGLINFNKKSKLSTLRPLSSNFISQILNRNLWHRNGNVEEKSNYQALPVK